MQNEPARISGYATLIVGSLIALIIAFGGEVTTEQKEAILGFVTALVPVAILLIEFIRSRVSSPATVARLKAQIPARGEVSHG